MLLTLKLNNPQLTKRKRGDVCKRKQRHPFIWFLWNGVAHFPLVPLHPLPSTFLRTAWPVRLLHNRMYSASYLFFHPLVTFHMVGKASSATLILFLPIAAIISLFYSIIINCWFYFFLVMFGADFFLYE